MKRMVLLTNILTPYRKVFYDKIYEISKESGFEFHVLVMSESERNRHWNYADMAGEYTILLNKKDCILRNDFIFKSTDLISRLTELAPKILVVAGGYTYRTVWEAFRWAGRNGVFSVFWSESHMDVNNGSLIKNMVKEIVRREFYKMPSGYWVPGERAAALVERYTKAPIMVTVPNLIDNRVFSAAYDNKNASMVNRNEEKVILFAPIRLIAVKGFDTFLDFYADYEHKDRFIFVIAGDGDQREKIIEKARNLKLNIQFLGYLERDAIIENALKSDFVFLPSISDASPLAAVEALWLGKPLLVSGNVGNAPETVDRGVNGFVFSYDDKAGTYELLDRISELDQTWYEEAEKRSVALARERFDLENETRRILRDTAEMVCRRKG